MIHLVKKTFGQNKNSPGFVGSTSQRLECGPGRSVGMLGQSILGLAFGSYRVVASRGGCNGLQFCGCQDFAKYVGRALLGKRLGLPGPMGRCAFAHVIQLLECPREVWATQRAFSHSFSKRSRWLS